MQNYQYEWWNVKIKFRTGTYIAECKAIDKEHAIKQFEKFDDVIEIYWDTMKLDRKGYQRRF